MLAWAGAHFHFAVALRSVEPGHVRIRKQLAPAAVDEDHQLRDEFVERAATRSWNNAHLAALAALGCLVPIDIEAVLDAGEIGFAAFDGKRLRELPEHTQFRRPRRVGGRGKVGGESFGERIET